MVLPSPPAPSAAPIEATTASCIDALNLDPTSATAIATCRARLAALDVAASADALAAERASIYAALARMAEAREHPEQAAYFLHRALGYVDDEAMRTHVTALASRPITATLHRPVFADVVFRPDSSLDTGHLLAENDASMQNLTLSPGTTARYETRTTDAEHDIELGTMHVVSPGERTDWLRLRHGAHWYALDWLDTRTEHGGIMRVDTALRVELVELVDGGTPEVVVESLGHAGRLAAECLFEDQVERTMRIFGLRTAPDGTEMGVRYAQILLERAQRHEPYLLCDTPPAETQPTFHWALDAALDPSDGAITLTTRAGEMPPEVVTRHDLRTLHCTWGPTDARWPCP